VWDRGLPIASLVARRTRQYPADFGYSSTFVETVEQNEVEDLAGRFLRSLNHSGLAEVEFKLDARDGRYKLLDVNARAWTWGALGTVAGVDFADVLWRLAMGEVMAPIRGQVDAAWMHDWVDVWAACREMLAGNLSPLSYVRSWAADITFAGFAKDDLVPGMVDLPFGLARVLARRLSRPSKLPIPRHDEKTACAGRKVAVIEVAELRIWATGCDFREQTGRLRLRAAQSTVPGLHFVGALAVASFCPLMRFIAGSRYAARSVTGAVLVHRARIKRESALRRDCDSFTSTTDEGRIWTPRTVT
jgi:hypothetical protein